jgi:spermidine synthase
VALAPGAARWSPYYRIDLVPYSVADTGGRKDPAGYLLTVNHDYHQKALNLNPAFVAAHPDEVLETARFAYDLPYQFVRPRRVLVVGAGLGNDVAAALRHGAERVDAVEIDPAILDLGRDLHPERPYSSPRVRLVNDDARAFFARTQERYDLIVFGLLDSHTLLSSMSSLRLDSYVYTQESFEQARARLAPGGHVALSFSTSVRGWEWLTARLHQMMTSVFGEEPVSLGVEYDVSTLYLIGPGVRERLATDPALAELAVDSVPLTEPVPPATDDWPFLYLRDRGVPWLPYGVTLLALLVVGGALVWAALRGNDGRPGRAAAAGTGDVLPRYAASVPRAGLDLPMLLLGAAFMLIEVKSISQLSLLFGSTWLVNALIITAILILALLANLFVAWWRPTHVGPAYVLLALALLADYLVPTGALAGQDLLVRTVVGTLLPALPLLFAGVIFATLFARTTAPGRAFGSNMLGALIGGLLEYASMAVGFKALGLVALGLYAASWFAVQRGSGLVSRARRRTALRAPSLSPTPDPLAVGPRPARRSALRRPSLPGRGRGR